MMQHATVKRAETHELLGTVIASNADEAQIGLDAILEANFDGDLIFDIDLESDDVSLLVYQDGVLVAYASSPQPIHS